MSQFSHHEQTWEKQVHLVKQVLKKLQDLVKISSNELTSSQFFPSFWILIVYLRLLIMNRAGRSTLGGTPLSRLSFSCVVPGCNTTTRSDALKKHYQTYVEFDNEGMPLSVKSVGYSKLSDGKKAHTKYFCENNFTKLKLPAITNPSKQKDPRLSSVASFFVRRTTGVASVENIGSVADTGEVMGSAEDPGVDRSSAAEPGEDMSSEADPGEDMSSAANPSEDMSSAVDPSEDMSSAVDHSEDMSSAADPGALADPVNEDNSDLVIDDLTEHVPLNDIGEGSSSSNGSCWLSPAHLEDTADDEDDIAEPPLKRRRELDENVNIIGDEDITNTRDTVVPASKNIYVSATLVGKILDGLVCA